MFSIFRVFEFVALFVYPSGFLRFFDRSIDVGCRISVNLGFHKLVTLKRIFWQELLTSNRWFKIHTRNRHPVSCFHNNTHRLHVNFTRNSFECRWLWFCWGLRRRVSWFFWLWCFWATRFFWFFTRFRGWSFWSLA